MYENETVLGTTPVGESCSPSSDTEQEKCARPTIKECVDRNKYCTGPPVVSIIIAPQSMFDDKTLLRIYPALVFTQLYALRLPRL